jgi:hypothetical protein
MKTVLSIVFFLAISFAALLALRSYQTGATQPAQSEQISAPLKTNGAALQFTFGVNDAQPGDWSGRIKVSGGRVEKLDARLLANDSIGGDGWRLRSRRQGQGANARIDPAQLLAVLDAPPDAQVEVAVRGRDFSFKLADVDYDKRQTFLGGAVSVERVPQFTQVTKDSTEDDFPACASGVDGSVWCVYVAYRHGTSIDREAVKQNKFDTLITRGHGDQIRLVKFDGRQWSGAWNITATGLDVWRPSVAVDAQGGVWTVWSQNTGGNWDLHASRFDPKTGRASDARRLTTDAGADINPVAVAAGRSVRVAWQGWRSGNFDIWLATLSGNRLQQPQRVSTSAANDWHPAMAANSAGDVWIAWDTYDRGNYDVMARLVKRDGPGEPIAVAASPRFEARPSIAVDAQNRAWIAFEDADANWGKDYGTRWTGKSGAAFYISRTIKVRCLNGSQAVEQTKVEVKATPVDTDMLDGVGVIGRDQRVSFPRLGVDPAGRVWLLFRRHPASNGQGERWAGFATYFDGSRWAGEIALPRSENLMDNRPAIATLKRGMLALYSTDNRTAGTNTAGENNLYAAALDVDGAVGSPQLATVNPRGDGKTVEPVHPDEAEDLRRIRAFRATVAGKTYQLLRGEFHRHTEISSHRDQDGPFEEIWRYGLDTASMDWIGPGDHDNGVGPMQMTHEYTWWLSQKQIDIYHHAPVFMPMFTYERSVVYPSGHRNVMFAKRGIRPLPRMSNQPHGYRLARQRSEGRAGSRNLSGPPPELRRARRADDGEKRTGQHRRLSAGRLRLERFRQRPQAGLPDQQRSRQHAHQLRHRLRHSADARSDPGRLQAAAHLRRARQHHPRRPLRRVDDGRRVHSIVDAEAGDRRHGHRARRPRGHSAADRSRETGLRLRDRAETIRSQIYVVGQFGEGGSGQYVLRAHSTGRR